MAAPRAEVHASASLAEAWEALASPDRFGEWVDGFGTIAARTGEWPQSDAEIVWRTGPTGRGTVRERVTDCEERRRLVVEFSDDSSTGTLATDLAMEGGGVRISQEMDYRLSDPGPFGVIAKLFFLRGQQRRSLERSLSALKAMLERSDG